MYLICFFFSWLLKVIFVSVEYNTIYNTLSFWEHLPKSKKVTVLKSKMVYRIYKKIYCK